MHITHPSWSYGSNIYEVNVRQYTREGTFNAFREHLPRLRDMGVEILWFMPVTPISRSGRKGTLGSYYAVQNYEDINPEFGAMEDFTSLVDEAHSAGFKVIIDWVANHSGNDNIWLPQHPDFYCYDENGIIHPHGWEDVSKLNFDNPDMQSSMIAAMKFWIDKCNIDGFRCDMAHLVPLEFWQKARTELDVVKPGMFWLAECEEVNYHQVFNATYTWKWMHASEEFIRGSRDIYHLIDVLKEYDEKFPSDALRIFFTSNHDENSWNGTEYEKYGQAAMLLSVFSCTWKGLPMIYSGQELPNNKRLAFFEKDEIEWGPCGLHNFYSTLLHLRKTNPALSAIHTTTTVIQTGDNERVFAYLRKSDEEEVLVILNLSGADINCYISDHSLTGNFIEVFIKSTLEIQSTIDIHMPSWGYRIYQKKAS